MSRRPRPWAFWFMLIVTLVFPLVFWLSFHDQKAATIQFFMFAALTLWTAYEVWWN